MMSLMNDEVQHKNGNLPSQTGLRHLSPDRKRGIPSHQLIELVSTFPQGEKETAAEVHKFDRVLVLHRLSQGCLGSVFVLFIFLCHGEVHDIEDDPDMMAIFG